MKTNYFMSARRAIFLFFISTFLVSCEFPKISFQEPSSSDGPKLPESRWLQALEILNAKCMGCHTQWGSPLSESNLIHANLVVPGSPPSSILITKIYGSGFAIPFGGAMPPGLQQLSEREIATLIDWVTHLSEQNSEDPPPAPSDPTTPQVVVGNRQFTLSFLESIFGGGASAFPNSGLNNLIGNRSTIFGGPCDYKIGGRSPGNVYPSCSDGRKASMTASNLPPTVLSEARLVRGCASAVSVSGYLNQVLLRVNPSISLTNPPPPSYQDCMDVYELFYPGQAPTQPELNELAQSLLEVASEAYNIVPTDSANNKSRRAWRHLILTVCALGTWRIL